MVGKRCAIGLGLDINDSDFHAWMPRASTPQSRVGAAECIAGGILIGSNAIVVSSRTLS
jgi:hypothetical protein